MATAVYSVVEAACSVYVRCSGVPGRCGTTRTMSDWYYPDHVGLVLPGLMVPGLMVPGLVVPGLMVPGLVVPGLVLPGRAGLVLPGRAGLVLPGHGRPVLAMVDPSWPWMTRPDVIIDSLLTVIDCFERFRMLGCSS